MDTNQVTSRVAKAIISMNTFSSIEYLLKRHCWQVQDFRDGWTLYVRDNIELDLEYIEKPDGWHWRVGYKGFVKGKGIEVSEDEAVKKVDAVLKRLGIWSMECHSW